MTPERWKQVDRLLQEALEREPAERAAFLAGVCGDDEELRREVESLLVFHGRAEAFIETPPADVAADWLNAKESRAGQTIGHYRLIRQIGRGGMGEVYLALDARLGRQVALKLLPPHFTEDAQRVQRFHQEARAASALNHPNILTIHEIGEVKAAVGALHFIATEFIEGRTLRELIRNGAMKLGEALEVAMQVASALSAAHAAGIIHRDIKPENIMLRPDGYVKVLDFGIAKLIGEKLPLPQVEHPTEEHYETDTGTVMGTAPYMSPEQARGEKGIDARTDIFSLGVVLYEMVVGQSPFAKPTFAETLGAILHLEPSPLASHRSGIPPALEEIVARAINKGKAERYQTAGELGVDLDRLKREMENARHPEPIKLPDHEKEAVVSKDRAAARRSGAGQMRWVAVIAFASGLALAAAAVYVIYRSFTPKPPFSQAEIKRLTDSGKIMRAAISPDGNYIVYAEGSIGKQSLQVRQVNGTVPHAIIEPDEVNYTDLTFSPDGEFVYYVRQQADENAGVLSRVRALDGSPENLAEKVDTPITFAPDGRSCAFGRNDPAQGRSLLVITKADGSDEKTLASHKLSDSFCLGGIAWSPDGKILACSLNYNVAGEDLTNVIAVRVSDGTETRISSAKWREINGIAWLRDGRGLLVVATEKRGSFAQIFHLSYPAGEVRQITHDLYDHRGISLTSDSRKLVTITNTRFSNIWLVPAKGDGRQTRQVTSGWADYADLSWTPEGNLLTTRYVNGKYDLWVMDTEGKNRKQLTSGPYLSFRGHFSPDGRYIVYMSNQNGRYNIWRMNADGPNKIPLTTGPGEYSPRVSPDSRWVYYYSYVSGQRSVWKVQMEGGVPLQLTNKTASHPVISPDGTLIACKYLDERKSLKWQTAVIPISGGEPVKTFELSPGIIRWAPDGKSLIYFDTLDGGSNLWAQPLDGGKPKRLTDFGAERITIFDWSRDGSQIALIRVSDINDLALLID